jgi:tRNA (adenine22-N1)-methyltransferase
MDTHRLNAIVNMVPVSDTIADIGCDHGKTGVMLIECGKAKRVIFGDISDKSLDKARKLAEFKGLICKISLRQGDGLEVLDKGEADTIVISGMGGELIADILENGKEKAPEVLVLSCNTKAEKVRSWLYDNGYFIYDEDMVSEGRHFYPIILARKGEAKKPDETGLELGPKLLEKKPPEFISFAKRKIEKNEEKRKKILESEPRNAAELLAGLETERKRYEEALICR